METRKEQIFNVTYDLVAKIGYDSLSYNDISKKLGITKASIHYHFPKKEDLGLEFCYWLHNRHNKFLEQIRKSHSSVWGKLDQFLAPFSEIAEKKQKVCPLFSLQAGAESVSKKMRAEILNIAETEVLFVEEILRSGRKSNEMKFKGDVRAQALMVCFSVKGALQYARIHGKPLYYSAVKQLKSNLKN